MKILGIDESQLDQIQQEKEEWDAYWIRRKVSHDQVKVRNRSRISNITTNILFAEN